MSRAILAIDCTQRVSHLVVERAGEVWSRSFEAAAHAEREAFWDEFRSLMQDSGVSPESLGGVAVATGPGGFTGLRVSMAVAKIVAFARSIPVAGLASAEVFAASDALHGGRGPWLVALASKSGTAFVVEVAASPDAPAPAAAGRVLDAAAFEIRARAVAAAGGAILSDGHLDPALAAAADRAGIARRDIACAPRALARLASAALSDGRTIDPMALVPEYAREPEAVTKWRARGASA